MADWLAWTGAAASALCVFVCWRIRGRMLTLEWLHAKAVSKSVRGAGSEPETVDAARKVK